MSGFKSVYLDPSTFTLDAGQRLRVSQLTTLADLKILDEDDTLLTENFGTGTGTYNNNTYSMSVTSGQYRIKCSKLYFNYYAGKSQLIECTFHAFNAEANVTKRIGYFSSNAVAPFNSNLDGFWLENTGSTIDLVVSNNGTEKLRRNITQWDNYSLISSYDWSKFTVIAFDYLWLGGAVLRLFLKTDKGFVLCHTFNYSGTDTGTFTRSPNHKIRYEVRSTTGSGSLTYICSQIATEGSIAESGKQRTVDTGSTQITLANIGTTYPLKAIRKKATHRDRMVKSIGLNANVSSNADILLLSLQLNPTLSASLTYTDVANSSVQEATGNGTITVTSPGTKLWSDYMVTGKAIPHNILEQEFLSKMGITLDDIPDQIVLCGTPVTAGITCSAVLSYKDF